MQLSQIDKEVNQAAHGSVARQASEAILSSTIPQSEDAESTETLVQQRNSLVPATAQRTLLQEVTNDRVAFPGQVATRQSVNVYTLNRGSLRYLGMDAAEVRAVRQKSSQIKFSFKYERRRTLSTTTKRDSFFGQMSAMDRRNGRSNRTPSVIAQASSAERDVWQLIKSVLPVRSKLSSLIQKHVVVDQCSPFVLFAIQIESEFSRFITKNTFENFELLQKKLVSLDNQIVLTRSPQNTVLTHRLKDVLPRLPTSFLSIFFKKSVPSDADLQERKRDLTKYSQQLLNLLQGTLAILQTMVHRSQNFKTESDLYMGASGSATMQIAEDRPPLTDLDHYIRPSQHHGRSVSKLQQETIPEEDDEENGMDEDVEMGGGIVDEDLDVNSTKERQIRQSLLSSGSGRGAQH